MNIFVYTAGTSAKGSHLIRDVRQAAPKAGLEVFRTYQTLSERLLKPRNALSIAILVAPKRDELMALIPLRGYFRETKILLILQDQDKETISLAHRLFPTYVSYTENNYSRTLLVLQNLIESHQNRSGFEGMGA
jgi:hypothetical protein